MPGTIKVSVLGFMDLPSPSSSPWSISVTVSMGRKQYQTLDKGDFSFSLTSIRDILVITANDVEGNEIARADIQAKSIVEKGFWDDHFPLEGGGRVHMQLQFVLNQDERHRIRLMRESATKKKQEEYLNINPKSLEGTAMARSNIASSFYLNSELSDSQKCLLQVGELSRKDDVRGLSSPSSTSINLQSGEKDSGEEEKGTDFYLNQQIPNDADRGKYTSATVPVSVDMDGLQSDSSHEQVAQTMDSHFLDNKVPLPSVSFEENTNILEPSGSIDLSEMKASLFPDVVLEIDTGPSQEKFAQKIDSHSLGDEAPVQTISLEENINLSRPLESTVASAIETSTSPNADEERVHEAEKQMPMKKVPSNVRKMIGAFEGGQAQDMRPQIKLPLTKTHSDMVNEKKPLKEGQSTLLKKEKTDPSSIGRDMKSSIFEEPKRSKEDVKKSDEEIILLQSLESTKLLEGTLLQESEGTALEEKIKDQPKESDSKDQPQELYVRDRPREENSEDQSRVEHPEDQPLEENSEDLPREENSEDQQREENSEDQPREENSEDQPAEVYTKDQSNEINMKKETQDQELIETSSMEAEDATVSERVADYQLGKSQLANLVDNPVSSSAWIFPDDATKLCITGGGKKVADLVGCMGGNSSIHKGEKKISMEERGGSGIGMIESTKTNQEDSESKHFISKGAETSEGAFSQALKMAIMFGFGALILFTRQRKKRNN